MKIWTQEHANGSEIQDFAQIRRARPKQIQPPFSQHSGLYVLVSKTLRQQIKQASCLRRHILTIHPLIQINDKTETTKLTCNWK